jgi:hypothetical protein
MARRSRHDRLRAALRDERSRTNFGYPSWSIESRLCSSSEAAVGNDGRFFIGNLLVRSSLIAAVCEVFERVPVGDFGPSNRGYP